MLAKGIVICFDTQDIEGQDYIDRLASKLSDLDLYKELKQVKQLLPAMENAEKKDQDAQAAFTAAKQAFDDCVQKNAKRCKEVAQLQQEYDECVHREATQAAADAQHLKDQAAAAQLAADQARRGPSRAGNPGSSNESPARSAQASRSRQTGRRRTSQEVPALHQLSQAPCPQAIDQAGAKVSPEQQSALNQLTAAIDGINDKLQKGETAADLIPQLSKLSELLKQVNAGTDAIDKVNKAVDQIKQLTAVEATRNSWRPSSSLRLEPWTQPRRRFRTGAARLLLQDIGGCGIGGHQRGRKAQDDRGASSGQGRNQ